MSTEVAVWRMGPQPVRLTSSPLPAEKALEDLIETDPEIVGHRLLVIGRQVATAHGGYVDLLGLDEAGGLHVVELKRDRTPREVVAQTLDYGSWASGLSNADIESVWSGYGSGPLAAAFVDHFSVDLPEVLNDEHHLTIVAGSLDLATERIVTYLAKQYGVRINVALFTHVTDGDGSYLARTWLLPEAAEPEATRGRAGARTPRGEPWNGVDLCFELGALHRSWEDARAHGFVSAGGGPRYTGRLRGLPAGSRLWVHLPGIGYVGHAVTIGPAQLVSEARATGGMLADKDLVSTYFFADPDVDADEAEWLVPVEWIASVPREQAVWERGMYANQSIVTQLRQPFTLDVLRRSPLAGEDSDGPVS